MTTILTHASAPHTRGARIPQLEHAAVGADAHEVPRGRHTRRPVVGADALNDLLRVEIEQCKVVLVRRVGRGGGRGGGGQRRSGRRRAEHKVVGRIEHVAAGEIAQRGIAVERDDTSRTDTPLYT